MKPNGAEATNDEVEKLKTDLMIAEENAKYYKTEYDLIGIKLRYKNKEILDLKKENTRLKNTIKELQENKVERLF